MSATTAPPHPTIVEGYTDPIDPYTPLILASSRHSSSPPTPCPPLPLPNHAALVHKSYLRVRSLPLPPSIPPLYALIAIRAVGICGSDVHYWTHGGIANFILTSPMITGHECAGEVLGVGEGVTSLRVGEKVAVEAGVACGACQRCGDGRYNLCPGMRFFGSGRPPMTHGALRRYLLHPARLCFPLPPHLSYAEGAMCEPLSVAVMAARRARLRAGMKVAIMGAGPIGLLTLLVAQSWGACGVLITDVNAARIQKARELGADWGLELTADMGEQEVVKKCKELMGGEADVAFDCVGLTSTANTALGVTMSGGVVLTLGLAETVHALNVSTDVVVREVELIGNFRYAHTYPLCIELLNRGKVDVKAIISHPMQLGVGEGEDWRMDEKTLLEGFDIARAGRGTKVMFHM